MAVRILIADDHEVVRLGLCAMFAGTEFEVVAQAANGKEAFQHAADHKPDVALLDARMPNGDGLSCLALMKLDLAAIQVVLFSAGSNPGLIARAVALGAAGCLMKSIGRGALLESLRLVAAGEALWSPAELQSISRGLVAPRAITDEEALLTNREREVLQCLASGLSNREIASALEVSYETVKEHVQHILQKVGVSDRTQAAVWAARQNLV